MAEQETDEKVSPSRSPLISWLSLQVGVIIVTLAVCRVIFLETYATVLLFSLYICLMSRFAYPSRPQHSKSPIFAQGRKGFKSYVTIAGYVGLYAPFAYIMAGLAMGHGTVVATAAPHTFLLAWQVLSELISGFCGPKLISPPSRALVPILYNSGRLVSIWAWLQADFASSIPLQPWHLLGRCLALANLALWTYNLFGFLLPIYLPFCFQRYFEHEKV